MRIAVSLLLVGCSVFLRKVAGLVLPSDHPLHTFELDVADLLQGAEKTFLTGQQLL